MRMKDYPRRDGGAVEQVAALALDHLNFAGPTKSVQSK
jgi:hypothetical protein